MLREAERPKSRQGATLCAWCSLPRDHSPTARCTGVELDYIPPTKRSKWAPKYEGA